MQYYVTDPQALREQLTRKGYRNLQEFAKSSGIHRNTLRQMLEGSHALSRSLEAVASTLKVDPLELIRPVSRWTSKRSDFRDLGPVVADLVRHDPHLAVVLFGSRVTERARRYSDWDLGVTRYTKRLTGLEFLRLKRLVGEATEDLAYQVDLVNIDQAPSEFLQNIAAHVEFLDGNREAWIHLQGILEGIRRDQTDA